MEQTLIPGNLLEAENRSPSITSNSSEEDDSHQTKSQKLLELDLIAMQEQSKVLPHQPTSFAVPSKESKKSHSIRYHGETQKKRRTQKALVELQPISASFCQVLGWSSTLQGTPWEDALSGSTQTKKRSIKTETDEKTFQEREHVAFWKQFFG